jgi:hypothetical protein
MIEWRPVVGYEGFYEVSEQGDVRSVPRKVKHWLGGTLRRRGVLLSPSIVARYLQVSLCREGFERAFKVHALVAAAFIGERPKGKVLRHRDGNKLNNHWTNICYGTHQENSDDMKAHGTVLKGAQHPNAKLTDAKVRKVRSMLATHTNQEIAERTGMSNQQISNIKLRKAWAHLEK